MRIIKVYAAVHFPSIPNASIVSYYKRGGVILIISDDEGHNTYYENI